MVDQPDVSLQPNPFRSSVGDLRACLDLLREADRLLDVAPRTERAELARQASDRRDNLVLGGLLGVAMAPPRLVGDRSVAPTPDASRELAEAVALLRKAVAELGDHPAAAQLAHGIASCERASITTASRGLALLVRRLHPALREELGLLDAQPLVDWNVHDVDDHASLEAAGLSARRRAIMIGIAVAITLAIVALLYAQIFGTQSKAEGMRVLCDIPINCSICMSELGRGDARRYRAYHRKHVTSPELTPMFDAMVASPDDALDILRAAAAEQGIPRCTLADHLARPIVIAE